MGGHSLCFGPGWEFLVLAVIIGRHSSDFLAGSALILSLSEQLYLSLRGI